MRTSSPSIVRRLIILAALSVMGIVCIGIYTTGDKRFTPIAETAATASYQPALTNPETIQDWLPATVYNTMLAHTDDYLRAHNLAATSMAMQGGITFSPDTYDFDLLIQPQHQVLGITVRVSNSSSTLSSAVFITGQKGAFSTAPTYVGFDTLIDRGASKTQVDELQQAFHTFAPTADNVGVATDTIAAPLDPSNPTVTYTFSVTVGGNAYNATFRCTGLTAAQLLLTDPNTKQQVFDSGTLNN